jgi:hypothetical protein
MRASDRLLPLLEHVRPQGANQWTACCPSHDDSSPSLSLRQVDDRLLLRCWTGCTTPDIVASVGLTLADLFDNTSGKPDPAIERRRRITADFQRWRSNEVLRAAIALRTRDQWILAATAAFEIGLMDEEGAFSRLASGSHGYSELEWRFETLLTGTMQEAYAIYCES